MHRDYEEATLTLDMELAVFQGIVEAAPFGVLALDEALTVALMNPAAEVLFGGQGQTLLGKPITDLIPAGLPQGPKTGSVASSEQQSSTRSTPRPQLLTGRKPDGSTVHLSASLSTLPTAAGPLTLVYVQDASESHGLEERSHSSMRLEAIGRLAGGVAHDFNNVLTAILGYSDILLRKLRADGPMWEELQQIRRAGERAAGLTRQLLAFSRKQVLAPVILDLNGLVSGMEDLLRRLIREDIQLSFRLDRGLRPVKADPSQVEQVLINLVVNARDAMPSGGKITISTLNAPQGKLPLSTSQELDLNPYAILSVADTGCGMDASTQARIFEPFFTTKEFGRGTGLGLATVYGIVRQSGGQIEVQSELGRGSVFQVYLPQVEGVATSAPPSPPPFQVPRGTGTILLAEDEEAVRLLAGRILEANGYRVLQARDGLEALNICKKHTGEITLLLTDVVMPRMNGRDLAVRAGGLRPTMKIMYMSGYTDTIIAFHKILQSGAAFLQKPFTPDVLVKAVREAIEHDAATPAVAS
jgi:PAS domain S-box-containing protein